MCVVAESSLALELGLSCSICAVTGRVPARPSSALGSCNMLVTAAVPTASVVISAKVRICGGWFWLIHPRANSRPMRYSEAGFLLAGGEASLAQAADGDDIPGRLNDGKCVGAVSRVEINVAGTFTVLQCY